MTRASPPRRITRSSLARFAYNNNVKQEADDIEDAIPDEEIPPRKRQRVVVATTTRTTTGKIKNENVKVLSIKEEEEEEEQEEEEEVTTPITTTNTKPKRVAPKTKKEKKTTDNPKTSSSPPPENWQEIYTTVLAMRRPPHGSASNAPVDTMGCERLASPTASPRDRRFQTLVALMLSSQTKDTVNAVAMNRLQTSLPASSSSSSAKPGLNLENILAVEPETLNELIRAVGFHNNKTRYLKRAAVICRDEHDGDIPDTIEGLVALPGVGPKMAHLCLSAAWDRTEGIGVDVHVHRITNLWGWHGRNGSKNPEDTRARLESWLPRDKWREINTLLVGLGQTVCLPVGRRCGDCDLGLKGLCPAAERKKVLEGRRVRESVGVVVDGETVAKVESEKLEVVEKEYIVNEVVKEERD